MAVYSSKPDVEKILGDMKNALMQNKICFIPRAKNMKTLAALGLLVSDVKDELMDLSYSDYISGPEVDRDQPSSDCLWIFKRRVNGQDIYIKFKVEYQIDGNVKVISFHFDEYA